MCSIGVIRQEKRWTFQTFRRTFSIIAQKMLAAGFIELHHRPRKRPHVRNHDLQAFRARRRHDVRIASQVTLSCSTGFAAGARPSFVRMHATTLAKYARQVQQLRPHEAGRSGADNTACVRMDTFSR